MALQDRRKLFGVFYPQFFKENLSINSVALDNRYYYATLSEAPGRYPDVSRDIIVSTTSNPSNGIVFTEVRDQNPGANQYRVEGQRVYFLSQYAGQSLWFDYYGIGNIVQASDITNGGGSTTPGGNNSYVQFNNAGTFGGTSGLTFDINNNQLTVGGQIRITGGTPGTGRVLTSDASGLATWENLDLLTVAGSDGDIQFRSGSALQATNALNWDTSDTRLTLTGNLRITSGVPAVGKVLTSDANGNATWQSPSAGSPSGLNTEIQYNNNGVLAGTSDITYDSTTETTTLDGCINVSGIRVL